MHWTSLPGVRACVCGLVASVLAGALGALPARGEDAPPPGQGDPLTGLAELPYWPIGFIPPGIEAKPDKAGHFKAALLAWVPEDVERIRAVFIIPANSDSKHIGEHDAVREVARRHEMAIVYMRKGDVAEVQRILDALAERTGIEEFRHVPWLPMGKSSRGMFPVRMVWQHPDRTIASFSYHGETPPYPPDESARLDGQTILHVNVNGETEWGGTWFVHVRPSLLNYRRYQSWLPHIAVAKGVDHGDYVDVNGGPGWGKEHPGEVTCIRVWDYLAVFMDKALALRLPPDAYATEGPIELRPVDASKGYLVDPFAVEDLFRQPHYPLLQEDGVYQVLKGDESSTHGYVAVAPAHGFVPAEGVPVTPLELGQSPRDWLVADVLRFAMERDPKTELGPLAGLRPAPGDTVTIDDETTTFHPIEPRRVGKNGGVSLQGVKKWGQAITFLAYTVLDVPAATTAKLQAPYSVGGRLQVALNGVPIEHKQVVAFAPGRYAMLAVLRLDGPNWGGIDPHFLPVSAEEIAQGRTEQRELDQRAVEQARLLAAGAANPPQVIFPYGDVPEDERMDMFWLADREQALAWFNLHAVHGQKPRF